MAAQIKVVAQVSWVGLAGMPGPSLMCWLFVLIAACTSSIDLTCSRTCGDESARHEVGLLTPELRCGRADALVRGKVSVPFVTY